MGPLKNRNPCPTKPLQAAVPVSATSSRCAKSAPRAGIGPFGIAEIDPSTFLVSRNRPLNMLLGWQTEKFRLESTMGTTSKEQRTEIFCDILYGNQPIHMLIAQRQTKGSKAAGYVFTSAHMGQTPWGAKKNGWKSGIIERIRRDQLREREL